ncbi:hypothetical protein D3C75_1088780 [compost metagenome]
MFVFVLFQRFTLGIYVAFLRRPQGQGADGVGKARAGYGFLFCFQLLGGGVVSGEEHFERCTVLDLRVELPGGAVGRDQFVAGVFFEVLGDGLDRGCEVGCDRDLDFIGPGSVEGEQAGQGSDGQLGRADTHEDSSLRLSL